MTEITNYRHNHLIDPHLEIWEWQIPGYLFLGGLVAGLMILNGFWRLSGRTDEGRSIIYYGAIAAPIMLSLGMFLLFLDLSYKTHVLKFYATFQIKSPMSWGAWILLAVYPVQVLALAQKGAIDKFGWKLTFLNPIWDFVKPIAQKLDKTLSSLNIILGVMLGIYTGILLSSFAARPLWNTALLGPLFLVSGLSAASAFNLLSKPTSLEKHNLVRWDVTLLVIEFVFLILILIEFATGPIGKQQALHLLMGGQFTAVFWVFVIALGIILPLWLEIRESLHKYTPHWLGPSLVLVGGLALRFVFVMAGQHSNLPAVDFLSSH